MRETTFKDEAIIPIPDNLSFHPHSFFFYRKSPDAPSKDGWDSFLSGIPGDGLGDPDDSRRLAAYVTFRRLGPSMLTR
ncbi:hypothetical protein J3R74_002740 [Puniceicoccus vermicola]